MRLSRRAAIRVALATSLFVVAMAPAVGAHASRDEASGVRRDMIVSATAAVTTPPIGGLAHDARALGAGFAALFAVAAAAFGIAGGPSRGHEHAHRSTNFAFRYAGRAPPRS